MAKSDCVVIWGTNAVATQVNVMTHAMRARKERGAKVVLIDIYRNATMEQADLALCLRPGTDGALAETPSPTPTASPTPTGPPTGWSSARRCTSGSRRRPLPETERRAR